MRIWMPVTLATLALVAAFAGPAARAQQVPTPPAGAGQAASAPPAAAILSPGPSAARIPATADEFDTYFKQVSNWGRWGATDERGAANLITEAKGKQAARLVRLGRAPTSPVGHLLEVGVELVGGRGRTGG